ncbi:MAG TPA: RluA family pseudouridine synthase [Polyangia bacterium]|nr:RluA family pseudouridine synthase [Polyangia bacterium]
MARFRVEPEGAGARVDQFVAGAVPGLSVAAARRLVALGAVRVDGRAARKGARLIAGQTVELDDAGGAAEAPDARRVRADPAVPISVLLIDGAFIAVDKAAGVPSHPQAAGETGTVANGLAARFPECATASPDPREGGLVHRLDTGTSGVLIAARSSAAWASLRSALSQAGCAKTYLAEVVGTPADTGASNAPIGRVGRRGARVRVDGGGRNPLPAHTTWEVVERRGETTLMRVRLSKGRTHQVRAHLAAAGHPIVGDELYGDGVGDLHLHAASVRFVDPGSGREILIEAPPPEWAKIRG